MLVIAGLCIAKAYRQQQAVATLRESQEELRDDREKYRSLIEQAFEAIVLLDQEQGELVEVNPKFTEWFGYSLPEDAPLKTEKILVDGLEKQKLYHEQLCTDGYLPVEQRTFRHKNGTLVFAERSVSLVNYRNKQYVMITYRNIAEQLLHAQTRK